MAGVVLLYAGQSIIEAFTVLTTTSAILPIFVWSVILASCVQYRRTRPDLHGASRFKVPGGYPAVVMVFAFFAFALWGLGQEEDTAQALMITPL